MHRTASPPLYHPARLEPAAPSRRPRRPLTPLLTTRLTPPHRNPSPSEALLEAVREHEFALLGKAYTNVGVSTAAAALGMDEAGALAFCTARNWTADAGGVMLTPVAPAPAEPSFEGLQQMQVMPRPRPRPAPTHENRLPVYCAALHRHPPTHPPAPTARRTLLST